MILTLLGGGGFRVPLVYSALLKDRRPGRVTELRLWDHDAGRLAVVASVLEEQASGMPDAPRVRLFTGLAEALPGSDFIFSAIRVGGMAGRAADERIALEHGVIGQETVGAGGISYALRTIPVAVRIAGAVRKHAPEAWFINFTNPAGVITEVLNTLLQGKVVGICDSPAGLARRALGAAGFPGLDIYAGNVGIDYIGLNHLGWLRGLTVDGADVLPELLADAAAVESFEEGKLFGAAWLQALGAVPNEYLHYYYFRRENLLAEQEAAASRGAYLERQQAAFYAAGTSERESALQRWERVRMDREQTYMAENRDAVGTFERDAEDLQGGGYEGVALSIMRALSGAEGSEARLILNMPNAGTLPGLDHDAVIEAPCLLGPDGIRLLPAAPLPDYAAGLVTTVKAVERATIEAALGGSRNAAYRAFAMHPLVDSVRVAHALLDGYMAHFPELAYLR
ncbi:6-phospho-beta-glucosidase [Arthrobacter sp. SW1]|uniref:6-phospho-beta-glucosidase n=1 Tax=Arthrobacter sp. SW1 TaxID=1920889 RepID=UPI000877C77F|nr:6-phospho-beta-glucosidase [Arthrobacter sp. SW1]OFI36578.1 6-phospho-beta-glucosidase [Arthrobacter sp. SW1]